MAQQGQSAPAQPTMAHQLVIVAASAAVGAAVCGLSIMYWTRPARQAAGAGKAVASTVPSSRAESSAAIVMGAPRGTGRLKRSPSRLSQVRVVPFAWIDVLHITERVLGLIR